eukprot:m.24643 g.24643  ORF g.24643 m.24643 type:complete len:217 (-) comp11539_c0_seq1:144-794(-)
MFQPIRSPLGRANSATDSGFDSPLTSAVRQAAEAIPSHHHHQRSLSTGGLDERSFHEARSTSPMRCRRAVELCKPHSKSCSSSPRPSRSSLQLRRARNSSLSLSLPTSAPVKNDEDTREERWTPEAMDNLFLDAIKLGPQVATARHDPTATPSPNDSDVSFSECEDSPALLSPFYPQTAATMTTPSPIDSDLDDDPFEELNCNQQQDIQQALQLDC